VRVPHVSSAPLLLPSFRKSLSFFLLAGFTAFSTLLAAPAAHADSVTLKNGDHLTGSVTQVADKKLTIHTDWGGDVVIAVDQINDVKMEKPVVLTLESKNGNKVESRKVEITAVERAGDAFTVTTPTGTETVPTAGITSVRTPAAQKAYEDSLHPGWGHNWTATANVSFALARGNSDTTTFGAGMNVVRPTPHDKTSLYFAEIYTHDGILDSTTANNITAGARYDHNLSPKAFIFTTGDFTTNALQELDLRAVAGGGFGWHVIARPVSQFDILGGVVWTHETYSAIPPLIDPPDGSPAITNSFVALDFGEQYTRKFGASSAFTEQAYFFPNLLDTGEYRATFNSGISTKIKSFLSWQTTISDVYVTDPPPSTKKNDFILTTGLGFTFTRK